MNTTVVKREIPKNAPPPILSRNAISLLNDLLFADIRTGNDPVEAVMVFGTSHWHGQNEIGLRFPFIHNRHHPSLVYLTGGETISGMTESHIIYDRIESYDPNFRKLEFRIDNLSMNTKENVEAAIRLGLDKHKTIAFLAKIPHRCRCELTLKKYLPQRKIIPYGYVSRIRNNGPQVMRDTWNSYTEMTQLIWGEFLRIELYGGRGDIAYPDDIREKVEQIRKVTG